MLQNLLREEDKALGNECANTIPNSCVSTRPERIPQTTFWLAGNCVLGGSAVAFVEGHLQR